MSLYMAPMARSMQVSEHARDPVGVLVAWNPPLCMRL